MAATALFRITAWSILLWWLRNAYWSMGKKCYHILPRVQTSIALNTCVETRLRERKVNSKNEVKAALQKIRSYFQFFKIFFGENCRNVKINQWKKKKKYEKKKKIRKRSIKTKLYFTYTRYSQIYSRARGVSGTRY